MIYDVRIQLPGLVSTPEEQVVQAAIEKDGDIAVVSWGAVMASLGKCHDPSALESLQNAVGVFGQSQPCEITGWNMTLTVTSNLDKTTVEKRVRDTCTSMFGRLATVIALARQAAHDAGTAAADATVGVLSDFTGGFGEQSVKDVSKSVLLNPWILGGAAVVLVILLLVAFGPDAGATAAAAAAEKRKHEAEREREEAARAAAAAAAKEAPAT